MSSDYDNWKTREPERKENPDDRPQCDLCGDSGIRGSFIANTAQICECEAGNELKEDNLEEGEKLIGNRVLEPCGCIRVYESGVYVHLCGPHRIEVEAKREGTIWEKP